MNEANETMRKLSRWKLGSTLAGLGLSNIAIPSKFRDFKQGYISVAYGINPCFKIQCRITHHVSPFEVAVDSLADSAAVAFSRTQRGIHWGSNNGG